ncbi:MAG: GGDEF domain-containing phosphodiesterase, partial [Erysipelotrichaceae bacterium]|nr:GGDEF domain-containing phosphodiesterase [Erysipelotrichaceae bacterium]
LTGLYTKEYFYSKAREILNNDEENEYFIICTNIENFKFYNDVFGQKAGDELLKSIALQITNIVPKEALCSRLNTDRFVMLFPLKNKDEVIEKLKQCIDGQHFQNFVLKFGVYTIIDRNIDIKTMCDRAKIACDNIKGKYDVFINEYDDRAREKLLKEMTIIENMEEALKNHQFIFYLQSKIDLKTNKIIGAEALVRWNHPQYGLIPPNDFVTLFEKNGFITFLDTYIWEQVFIFLENEKKNNIPLVPISINISRVDFFKIDLVEFFSSLLKKYDVEAKYVHLEITESAYIENTNKIIGVIKKLREMNFVIEMDDFGSGYSSLNMLSKLDVDVIKLDRKFIQDEIEKEVGANIISFIVSLAHKLNISVVAEGVENYLHMSTLKNMGCDYAQGYYFSMPMNNKAFIKLIMEKANKEEIIQI